MSRQIRKLTDLCACSYSVDSDFKPLGITPEMCTGDGPKRTEVKS